MKVITVECFACRGTGLGNRVDENIYEHCVFCKGNKILKLRVISVQSPCPSPDVQIYDDNHVIERYTI